MKKAILILLCSAMLVGTVSCNKNDDMDIHKENNDIKSNFVFENQQIGNEKEIDNNITSTDNQFMNFSNLTFYDMRSNYDSYYINRSPIAKYAVTNESKLCVYIQEWGEYRVFPFRYDKNQDLVNCVNIYESNGILLNEKYGTTDKLNVVLFSKGNNKIDEININLDRTIHLRGLFGSFEDEKNGYIFVFEEVNNFTAVGGTRLAFLLKTHNGGKTWTETAINNSPIVSTREDPCIAEFIDDNIGIISCRYSASEDMCQRTFFTFDGGKTWETMSALPYDFKEKNGYDATEIADFSCVDGEYWLNVRVRAENDNIYYIQFKSLNLNSWILVE